MMLKFPFQNLCTLSAVKNISLIMVLTVTSKRMLVNRSSTSRLAITFLVKKFLDLLTSPAKMNHELCTNS